MKDILKIKNLKKIYHNINGETSAIKDFSFDVKEEDFIAIVGPSGCGKSTILSILCGLEDKSGGQIDYINNVEIGYMLQQDSLFEWRNILDNCLLGLEIKNKLTKDTKDQVLKMLNNYGLKDFIYSYPENLSGGMRQRVG